MANARAITLIGGKAATGKVGTGVVGAWETYQLPAVAATAGGDVTGMLADNG